MYIFLFLFSFSFHILLHTSSVWRFFSNTDPQSSLLCFFCSGCLVDSSALLLSLFKDTEIEVVKQLHQSNFLLEPVVHKTALNSSKYGISYSYMIWRLFNLQYFLGVVYEFYKNICQFDSVMHNLDLLCKLNWSTSDLLNII